jgi:hypothetical protein
MADRSKEKLKKEIKEEVTSLFEKVLDYAQVACPTPDTFKVLRSKVLRVGNDCIRNLQRKVDTRYDVEYTAVTEEIIEFGQAKK